MNDQQSPQRLILGTIAVSLLISLSFLFDWFPVLRGAIAWQWPSVPPSWATIQIIAPGLLLLPLYGLGLRWLWHRRAVWFLGWVCAAAVGLTLSWLRLSGDPLYELYDRTVSVLTTGSYAVAAQFDSFDVMLRGWPNSLANQDFGRLTHMSVSPPGWPIIYLGLTKLFATFPSVADPIGMGLRTLQCHDAGLMRHTNAQIASAWFGMLSPLWSALTVFPMYGVAKQVTADRADSERLSRLAVSWWPLVPSAALFVGTHNSPAPLFAMGMCYFFVCGLRQFEQTNRAKLFVALAGALTVACIVINFSFVPLIMLCGWLALLWHQPVNGAWSQFELRRPIELGGWYAVGCAVALLLYRVVTGHFLWALLPLIFNVHYGLEYAYLPWVWLHTWDFVIWLGLPTLLLLLLSVRRLPDGPARRLALSVVLTVGIMILSGTARGETGRIWVFFMPLVLIPVVMMVDAAQKHRALLWASQLFWLLVFVIVIRPVGSGLTRPPAYEVLRPNISAEIPLIPVNARLGDDIQLVGYQADYSAANQSLTLWLHWRPLRQMQNSYLFSTLSVQPDGSVANAQEWLPFDFQYPTTCWAVEQTVIDYVTLDLGDAPQTGDWWLSLSSFTLDDAGVPTYLPVMTADGGVDPQQIGLGPFAVSSE